MKIIKFPTEVSLMNNFDEAHSTLVQAAKIAHLNKHPEAQNISRLIDALEDIVLRVSCEASLKK